MHDREVSTRFRYNARGSYTVCSVAPACTARRQSMNWRAVWFPIDSAVLLLGPRSLWLAGAFGTQPISGSSLSTRCVCVTAYDPCSNGHSINAISKWIAPRGFRWWLPFFFFLLFFAREFAKTCARSREETKGFSAHRLEFSKGTTVGNDATNFRFVFETFSNRPHLWKRSFSSFCDSHDEMMERFCKTKRHERRRERLRLACGLVFSANRGFSVFLEDCFVRDCRGKKKKEKEKKLGRMEMYFDRFNGRSKHLVPTIDSRSAVSTTSASAASSFSQLSSFFFSSFFITRRSERA